MKKKLIGLLLVLVFVASACLVACQDNSQAIIDSVVFDKNNAAVSSEFVLSAKAGDKTVTWTSNNPAVELVLSEDKTEYVAKINPPEDKQVVVTLTVSLGNAKKDFTVKVNPITADDIADEYLFPKNNATVIESFTLDTKATYKGKEATITWAVENDADKDYIEVKDGKCVVTVSSLNPEVTITGSFTYKGDTVKRNYRFTVSMPMTHLEEIDYWYSNTGVGRDLKGYIVAIAETYPKYDKYISFYLMDEELNAGYYIYRLDIGTGNSTEAAKFVPGAYVVISGKVNTTYNGLYETNNASGATWTFDDSKKINIDEHIYAIDNDILAGSPAERRHTGTLVSLTNWKVKSVAETPDTDGKVAALILEKAGKTVAVSSSKYMSSYYVHDGSAFDATGAAIANLCKTYKVGDVVSVTGLLSYYAESGKEPASTNGIQILPRSAADVKKGTADAADTKYDGVKVGTMLAKINETLTTSGLSGIVVSAKEATLPATQDGVTVAYKLCSSSNAVKLEGTKLTVTPSKNEKVNVQVDLTCGTYTTTVFFTIESRLMTDAQIVEAEKTALDLDKDELTKAGSLDLVVEGQVYDGVTIDWALKAGSTLGKVENGKYTVGTLPEEDTEVVLVATIKRGQATATKEFKVTVKAATYTLKKADMKNLEEGKAYALIVDQTNRQETLFATGDWSLNKDGSTGYYAATSTDHTKAAKIYVEKVEGGIKLSIGTGADKKYLGFATFKEGSSSRYNLSIGGKVGGAAGGKDIPADATDVNKSETWVVTEDGILSITSGTSTNYFGTNGTYNTFSLNQKTEGLFAAYLAEVVDKAPIVKADVNNLVENKAYKLVMNQEQLGRTLYAQGEFSGYYLASTEDFSKAGDIYVEKTTGGVKLYFKDGNNKIYLGVSRDGTFNNVAIGGKVGADKTGTGSKDPAATATVYDVWTITANGMSIKISDTASVCLGTQTGKTFNTFSFRNGATAADAEIYGAYLAEVKA